MDVGSIDRFFASMTGANRSADVRASKHQEAQAYLADWYGGALATNETRYNCLPLT
jgi:hypothetical protein